MFGSKLGSGAAALTEAAATRVALVAGNAMATLLAALLATAPAAVLAGAGACARATAAEPDAEGDGFRACSDCTHPESKATPQRATRKVAHTALRVFALHIMVA